MISVCIAAYNGGELLKEQLISIVSQLSDDDEVVVSEDGDIDATQALVEQIDYMNIRVVEGPRQHSPIYNFERSLQHAQGDVIFLADQDDKWVEGKVQVMLKALEDADCVCSDCLVTDGKLDIVSDSFYSVVRMRRGRFFNLLVRNCYLGCCMAFRREVLDRALPFPKGLPMHDIWIGNVAAFFYRMKFIDEKLIYFRRHGNTTSSTAHNSPYSLLRKIGFRCNIVKNLLVVSLRKTK